MTMMIYVENSEESTKKTTGTNKKLQQDCRITRLLYKIQLLFYTSNEEVEIETRNTPQFTLTSPIMKYFCVYIYITKYVQDLCEENNKTDERKKEMDR